MPTWRLRSWKCRKLDCDFKCGKPVPRDFEKVGHPASATLTFPIPLAVVTAVPGDVVFKNLYHPDALAAANAVPCPSAHVNYEKGRCKAKITQYQKHAGKESFNDSNDFKFEIWLTDNKRKDIPDQVRTLFTTVAGKPVMVKGMEKPFEVTMMGLTRIP